MIDCSNWERYINPELIALERIWDENDLYSFKDYKQYHPDSQKTGYNFRGKQIKWADLERTIQNIEKNWARQFLSFMEEDETTPPPRFLRVNAGAKFKKIFLMHNVWKILDEYRESYKDGQQPQFTHEALMHCIFFRIPVPGWLFEALLERFSLYSIGEAEHLEDAFSLDKIMPKKAKQRELSVQKTEPTLTLLLGIREYLADNPDCSNMRTARKAVIESKGLGISEITGWRDIERFRVENPALYRQFNDIEETVRERRRKKGQLEK